MSAISGNLTDRVRIASKMLMNPPKDGMTRAFDNCFEMGDGDEVVRRIVRNAKRNPKLQAALEQYGTWESWGLV